MLGQAGPCDVGHHVTGILVARPVHFLQMTCVSQHETGAGTLFMRFGNQQAVSDLATGID